ncbi:hypothetical protein ACHAWF_010768 [Thalassiosira exigua]
MKDRRSVHSIHSTARVVLGHPTPVATLFASCTTSSRLRQRAFDHRVPRRSTRRVLCHNMADRSTSFIRPRIERQIVRERSIVRASVQSKRRIVRASVQSMRRIVRASVQSKRRIVRERIIEEQTILRDWCLSPFYLPSMCGCQVQCILCGNGSVSISGDFLC